MGRNARLLSVFAGDRSRNKAEALFNLIKMYRPRPYCCTAWDGSFFCTLFCPYGEYLTFQLGRMIPNPLRQGKQMIFFPGFPTGNPGKLFIKRGSMSIVGVERKNK